MHSMNTVDATIFFDVLARMCPSIIGDIDRIKDIEINDHLQHLTDAAIMSQLGGAQHSSNPLHYHDDIISWSSYFGDRYGSTSTNPEGTGRSTEC